MVASERIHIPLFALNNPLYMNIKGKVTTFALRKINEQHQKANCATKWPKFQQTAARATLDNMINAPTMVLQNPKEVSTRGCPTIASQHNSENSTRRDPSGFELVEYKGRHCTLCRQPGHNSRTCPSE
ncbi:7339_t:CDS:2, partial [Dentiscutata heterogama]